MDSDMKAYRAVAIFSDIWNPEISDHEKAVAIWRVIKRPLRQLCQVKKETMLEVIRWLWERCFRAVPVQKRQLEKEMKSMTKQKTGGKNGTQYSDVDVRCPCFKAANDTKKTLICEGALEGTRIRFSLRQKKRYDTYRRCFCEGAYENCPYYRAVEARCNE